MRLAKIMAKRNVCSRREAEKLISAGHVRIAGEVITELGKKWPADVEFEVDQGDVENELARVTIMIHKPEGLVSHLPEPGQSEARGLIEEKNYGGQSAKSAMVGWVKQREDLSVAGRLDRASRGLLVMTSDGRIVRQITGSGEFEKIYHVRVERDVEEHHLKSLRKLRKIRDHEIQAMHIEQLGSRAILFKLHEGKKHQIRRACRAVGLNVMDLFRVSIGPLELGQLAEGQWREVTEEENKLLLQL